MQGLWHLVQVIIVIRCQQLLIDDLSKAGCTALQTDPSQPGRLPVRQFEQSLSRNSSHVETCCTLINQQQT